MSLSRNLRKHLVESFSCLDEKEVAIAVSGGIDSWSLVFACMEAQQTPVLYSFCLDGKISTDFSLAAKAAKHFGLDFTPVLLPSDIKTLRSDLAAILPAMDTPSKTTVECTWPIWRVMQAVKQNVMVTGTCADGHFVLNKKGMIHHRHTVDGMDAFRKVMWANPDYGQHQTLSRLAEGMGKEIRMPYRDKKAFELFKGTAWHDLNKPKQKQIIRDTYPEKFACIRNTQHLNLQDGDSGIKDHLAKLLKESDLNPDGAFKNPVAIYRRLHAEITGRNPKQKR